MMRSKLFARGWLVLFLCAGLLVGLIAPVLDPARAAPVKLLTEDIVIGEFRTRGPAGPTDQFVDLFNPSAGTVNLNGWYIKTSNYLGVTTNIYTFSSSVLLAPGKHYLIANSGYSASLVPDDYYVPSVTDNGGIAVFRPDNTIADQVGMNNGSVYKEGTPLSPLTTNTDQAYERNGNEYVDTDNNAADFSLISPSTPQNYSSIPVYSSNVPTSTPTNTATSTNTPTATGSATPTNTPLPTNTPTATPNCVLTPTPTTFANRSVLINEVGWMGTQASSSDEWVELYNPGSCDIVLNNWSLVGYYFFSINFTLSLSGIIPAGGYYLIADRNDVFQKLNIDLANSNLNLQDYYSSLQLIDPYSELIDTANYSNSYRWPAGIAYSSNASLAYSSMERIGNVPDSNTAWVTYAGPTTTIKDRNGNLVHGTPGGPNWAWNVTITPSPTSTKTKRPPTPIPPTLAPRMVINEFLPRPGSDWNGDGQINVYDEFIEIENLGPGTINIGGWRLDDLPPGDAGSYIIPSMSLKVGQRAVFYGLTTHILLQDSGETVRLINTRGVVVDARTYGPVDKPDVSTCRIPDGIGYWRDDCFPTPGLENALTGVAPVLPPAVVAAGPPPCLLPDNTPLEFVLAVCSPFGDNIWNRAWWDNAAGQGEFIVPDDLSKWETIVQ